MIRKRQIKQFVERKLKDFRKWKRLSLEDLEEIRQDLPIRPPIWSKLHKHQKVCFLIGAKHRRFAYWLDVGTGKTLISIALIRYFKQLGELKRAMVLVPNRINKAEWAREILKHSPQTKYEILVGSSADKWEQLEKSDATIFITTYMGFVRMVCVKVKQKKKKGLVLKPDKKLVKRLMPYIDGMFLDESDAVQNRKSLAFRICRQVSKNVELFFDLSGTPFGKDPQSLWSQMFLVDFGETLGKNLTMFRAVFYKSQKNFFTGFPEYKFDTKKKALLHRTLAHRSIRYEANSADLPKVVPIPKEITLPEDADNYYKMAKQRLIESHGNFQEQKNAFMRMRQISSGWLGYKDDETGTKAQLKFYPNHKLEMLTSFIESISPEHKFIVYHEFIYSGHLISDELKKLGIKHSRVYGRTRDEEEQLRRFTTDPDCQAFVFNSAGAYGVNLQMAKYLIFFESPIRPVIRKQVEGRVKRQGALHDVVFIVDLVTLNTADEQILKSLREGRNLFEDVIAGRARGLF